MGDQVDEDRVRASRHAMLADTFNCKLDSVFYFEDKTRFKVGDFVSLMDNGGLSTSMAAYLGCMWVCSDDR